MGFDQAIVLGERGPGLNMNNTFCSFYENYNLVKFRSCYLNNDIRRHVKNKFFSIELTDSRFQVFHQKIIDYSFERS